MAAPVWGSVRPEHAGARYRSAKLRSRFATALIGLTTGALAGEALLMVSGFRLMDRITEAGAVEEAQALDASVTAVQSLYLVCFIASVIAFLAWLSRSVDNAPAIGGGSPGYSPRAAIGWWFAPFANLVVPYRVVADLWNRLAPSAERQGTRILITWWVLWIGSNIAANLLLRSFVLDTVEALRTYFVLAIVVYAANAVAGVLLIRIILTLETWAGDRAANPYAFGMPDPTWSVDPGPASAAERDPTGQAISPGLLPPPPPAG